MENSPPGIQTMPSGAGPGGAGAAGLVCSNEGAAGLVCSNEGAASLVCSNEARWDFSSTGEGISIGCGADDFQAHGPIGDRRANQQDRHAEEPRLYLAFGRRPSRVLVIRGHGFSITCHLGESARYEHIILTG